MLLVAAESSPVISATCVVSRHGQGFMLPAGKELANWFAEAFNSSANSIFRS